MRIHWWQSIRWRLAIGSVLLTFLAVTLLAITALLAIVHYYSVDLENRMDTLAGERAQSIGIAFEQNGGRLGKAVQSIAPASYGQGNQNQFIQIVLGRGGGLIYPPISNKNQRTILIAYLLQLSTPIRKGDAPRLKDDALKLNTAIRNALEKGQSTRDRFSQNGTFGASQPFVVRPIFSGGLQDAQIIGALVVMTTRPDNSSSFIVTVGSTVLEASLAIAVIAAIIAILFARTITRPLAKLTRAARVLGSGDYSAQVATNAPGELGELAHTFNEMAAQLDRDVEMLRRQEVWRRELLMSITHDLATPLTAIAGLGESLIDGVNQSREDYEETGKVIVRETLRLRRLVKDLHVMAKVEAGALHPQRKPVRIAALVDEVLAVLAPEFERLQVEPYNAIPYNLPAVQADPDMLTRVFSNLCDNALRHTPEGGTVTVSAEDQGTQLVISVTDTGEGIPPEALSRVFERFFRADSARQSSTGGSGLGLAIVRAIVEGHGGTVHAENAPGAGARISFTLPLSADRTQPLRNEETATTITGTRKALRGTHLKKLETHK